MKRLIQSVKTIILISSTLIVLTLKAQITVSTIAGNGISGFTNGTGTLTSVSYPYGMAIDATGNIFFADAGNNRIRKINSFGVVSTFAGTGIAGFADGPGAIAQFNTPTDVAIDASGNLYVSDIYNNCIRKITSAGIVSTLAGTGIGGYVDGAGNTAQFYQPMGVAIDASGNIYVADKANQRIRKISSGGIVSTLAGSSAMGYVDGFGAAAQFKNPMRIAVDAADNLYVTDGNHVIRKVDPSGLVTTFAGSGSFGSLDGMGTAAQFNVPNDIAIDGMGNMYVADTYNNKIRKITPMGVVTTLAGTGAFGFMDGALITAQFNQPQGIDVDALGNIYISDTENFRIRKIGTSTTTAINKNGLENTVSLSPNPTSLILNIEVKEQTQIVIINMLGEIVKTEIITDVSILDVSDLNAGVYSIIESKSGKATKFIKQ